MGSVYVPPASSSGDTCSGGCGTINDAKYNYLRGYFNAHMLSMPSHRYEYITWFVFVLVIGIMAAFHHVGLGDRTYIGAAWNRWALKNRVIKVGKKESATIGKASRGGPTMKPPKRRRVLTFPSFGRLLLLLASIIVPTVLTIVGADYIRPSAGVFDMSESWPNTHISPYTVGLHRRLSKRVLWGQGAFPLVTTNAPTLTLPYRTWWTAGGRTGGMTNALTPFVVVLALKQVPFALLSTRLLGGMAFDRLSFLHKWGGRVVWLFATAHIATWSVQLGMDQAFGTSMWGFVFMWEKFRWGWVAYGFITLLVVLSIGPIRTDYYEFFYIVHVICAIGFMVATWLHHPPLGPWMYATLLWWLLERVVRAIKVAYINGIGFAGSKPTISPATATNTAYAARPLVVGPSSYARHPQAHALSSQSSSVTMHSGDGKAIGYPPMPQQDVAYEMSDSYPPQRRKTRVSARYDPVNDLIDGYTTDYTEAVPLRALNGASRVSLHDEGVVPALDDSTPSSEVPTMPEQRPEHPRWISGESLAMPPLPVPIQPATVRSAAASDLAAILHPGYAYAQLLPGKTLRLTLRTPNAFVWKPGQYINLNIPSVKWWQSHPFTIASAYECHHTPSTMFDAPGWEDGLPTHAISKGEARTVVLLLRARNGFTYQLWNHVRLERERQIRQIEETTGVRYAQGDVGKSITGVHLRAIIDGPFGGAQRIRWHQHATVVIICGGSGVSSGLSALEYLCACLAGLKREKGFQVRRVRFVWILREYSHLQWIATALRRCIGMVPPNVLQVDIFVTSPTARRQHARRLTEQTNESLSDSDDDHGNATSAAGHRRRGRARFTEGPDQEEYAVDAYALTQFDGEDYSAPTAAEARINERVHKEGQLRRAVTRRATQKRVQKRPGTASTAASKAHHRQASTQTGISEDAIVRAAQARMYQRTHQAGGSHDAGHMTPIQSFDQDLGEYAMSTYESDMSRRAAMPWSGEAPQPRPGYGRALVSPQPHPPQLGLAPATAYPGQGAMPHSLAPLPPSMGPSPVGTPGFETPGYSSLYGMNSAANSMPSFYGNNATSTTHLNGSFGGYHDAPTPPLLPHHASSLGHQYSRPDLKSQTSMAFMAAEGFTDVPIDLDEAENADLAEVAELARAGYPKLDRIIREEAQQSQGRVLVSACGPSSLGDLIRSVVSKQIDLKALRQGQLNAHINVTTESYEWGG